MAMEAMEAWGAALVMEDWVLVAVAMEEVSEAMVVMVVMVAMGLEAWGYLEDMELGWLGPMEGGREVVTKSVPD